MKRGEKGRSWARSRGFTLVESMVVVALIGVIVSIAAVMMGSDNTSKSARTIAAIVREARRQALSRGTVDPVAAAAGNVARVQIEFVVEPAGSFVRLWVLDDSDPTNSIYVELSQDYLSTDTEIYAVGNTATTFSGDPLPAQISGPIIRNVYPDGSCDAMTVFIKHKSKGTRYRVAVLPITTIPAVGNSW